MTSLTLDFGFRFEDLYDTAGLARLDARFLEWLRERAPALAAGLGAARAAPPARDQEAELLLSVAPEVEAFVARLFGIESELDALIARHLAAAPLYSCKRLFVQRRAMHEVPEEEALALDADQAAQQLEACFGQPFTEAAFAAHVNRWLEDEPRHGSEIALALRYAAWAVKSLAGQRRHRPGVLFKVPAKLAPDQLIRTVVTTQAPAAQFRAPHLRRRAGFALTDPGTDLVGALDQANYCIWCHSQGRDSCSHGLVDKKKGGFKKSAFGVTLAGCPLEERISEFQKLKAEGVPIGALATIMIDNPLCAATGHRICNDCMKSCIYQKQEPVNIPEVETRTLKDVLALRWGFEIYSLLSRWNPLNLKRPVPEPATGRRALIVGMGPAGFTLAHHLLNEGHAVVGIDGLKIEPLPSALTGVEVSTRVAFEPIERIETLHEDLDRRAMAGFGGVAEYGITVRWDKNFLKIIRLLLERRADFALCGGVRFGGTLGLANAFELGFDHVALAMGAGRPTVLDLPNGLAQGVRTASDFLMALQLTGAAKADSIANMQLRLPVVVIGGGLTAIDTATESLAYYPLQVEKFLERYEILAAEHGEDAARARWSGQEAEIADEFMAHARAIREERRRAALEQREARIVELLQSWGGVTIAYRKRLIDSPAYTLNHEEVEKALEEGITFAECLSPVAIDVDAHKHAAAIDFAVQQRDASGAWQSAGSTRLPARTVLIAAGTQPNTVLAREDAAHFALDGRYFAATDEQGHAVAPEYATAKPVTPQILLRRMADGRYVSFFGDQHPSYFGNVVKAMGSATQGYPIVSRLLRAWPPTNTEPDADFLRRMRGLLQASVHEVIRLTPTIVEVVLHAPLAAAQFRPGQFYRLQNFEAHALSAHGSRLAMEGLALTGAWVDPARGLISTIVLEMGGSSSLCAYLQPGEPVVLMGPTGAPTEIPADETVLLVGGGLGNAVLFSIGAALRAAGSRVLYFAGYKALRDRYKVADIEAAADVVIWCCDEAPGFVPTRAQDRSFVGNIVQAMRAYARGELGAAAIGLDEVRRMIVIGSDRMMGAVAGARHRELAGYLRPDHVAIGSINSPMQCMMKEICAQCLQPHVDPATGQRSYVFSCFNQDQPLDRVDFDGLAARLAQNSTQEKLTAQWLAHCLEAAGRAVPRV